MLSQRQRAEILEARCAVLMQSDIFLNYPWIAIDDLVDIDPGRFRADRLRQLTPVPPELDETDDAGILSLAWTEASAVFIEIVLELFGQKHPTTVPALLRFQTLVLGKAQRDDPALGSPGLCQMEVGYQP